MPDSTVVADMKQQTVIVQALATVIKKNDHCLYFLTQPCKVFMKEEDVKFMLNEMIQRSEQLCFR